MTRLVVGTAGHIDHGKSTLVHALTGIDPDRLKEEKARGITIELGFAHARIDEARIAFVDVPGHEKFVRTMLAGVGGVDFVMLVIAADESVMPQTREHFDICRLLHVVDGCVVITKADAADADTRALVALEASELVRGSFLDGKPIVQVSARTGEGLDELRGVLRAAAARAQARPESGAVRLPIDRVFTMKGFGTVVTGTLVAGRITIGHEYALLPGERLAKVRGIQVHGAAQESVSAGQRAAVNLGGVEAGDLGRGQTLAAPGTIAATRRADVLVELLPGSSALRHGARLHVHHGTAEVLGRLSIAGEQPDIAAGATAPARLRFETPAVLTRGDRVVLRSYSPPVTIGAAIVLDPAPAARGIRSQAGLGRLRELQQADASGAFAAMVRDRGLRGVPFDAAVARAGLAPPGINDVVARLTSDGAFVRVGDRLVSASALGAAADAVVALVRAFHAQHPISEGLPREEARARVFRGVDAGVFEAAMQRLVSARAIVDRERLALPSHKAALPGGEATVERVEAAYRDAGLTPPDRASVAERAGVSVEVADAATAYLVRQKNLLKLDTLVVHREALERLKRDMAALKAEGAGGIVRIDVLQFKDRYGVTRKYAIPLLEFLDRERVTRRVGVSRVLL
ncbi:MAG TPA: selenocysteine-specific translation elongation factor [Vicinamibacterales bacterium]|nr:selenocysteine-specific translation elongation factor [Vicinamibacterales bacterium]